MKKLLIAAASEQELEPFSHIQAPFFIETVCTGIGPYQTSLCMERLPIHEYFHCLFVGLAGSCDVSRQVGTIIHPTHFGLLEWHPSVGLFPSTYPIIDQKSVEIRTIDHDQATLWTSPIPLYDRAIVSSSESIAYIDMEAYALAREAQKKGTPFTCCKIISDYCTQDSSLHIKKTIKDLSEKLCAWVEQTFIPQCESK